VVTTSSSSIRSASRRRGSRPQDGFTVLEVLIALTILLIGIAGLLSMQLTAMRATSFSRHATEASMLGEDKMEVLRTVPLADLISGGPEQVDSRGQLDPRGPFTRTWTVALVGADSFITVEVAWLEQGETYTIRMTTVRNL
jgi:type IV pilus assembly protein PilV